MLTVFTCRASQSGRSLVWVIELDWIRATVLHIYYMYVHVNVRVHVGVSMYTLCVCVCLTFLENSVVVS